MTRSLRAARRPRRLRLIETLPLGEKRFLAVVEVTGRELLIGGTASTVALLENLGGPTAARRESDGDGR